MVVTLARNAQVRLVGVTEFARFARVVAEPAHCTRARSIVVITVGIVIFVVADGNDRGKASTEAGWIVPKEARRRMTGAARFSFGFSVFILFLDYCFTFLLFFFSSFFPSHARFLFLDHAKRNNSGWLHLALVNYRVCPFLWWSCNGLKRNVKRFEGREQVARQHHSLKTSEYPRPTFAASRRRCGACRCGGGG